jgi:hypothetical protein
MRSLQEERLKDFVTAPLLSEAVTENVVLPKLWPGKVLMETVDGQVMVGGVLSTTMTRKEQPALSTSSEAV